MICENVETKQLMMYTKGSDAKMKPLIKWTGNQESNTVTHLDYFAVEGLRTLVMGKKELSDEEF